MFRYKRGVGDEVGVVVVGIGGGLGGLKVGCGWVTWWVRGWVGEAASERAGKEFWGRVVSGILDRLEVGGGWTVGLGSGGGGNRSYSRRRNIFSNLFSNK